MATPVRCQLYLAAPPELPPDFATTLTAVLEGAEIACLRLPALPGIEPLIRLAQGRGTAVVIEGDPELAAVLGADGVHLADLKAFLVLAALGQILRERHESPDLARRQSGGAAQMLLGLIVLLTPVLDHGLRVVAFGGVMLPDQPGQRFGFFEAAAQKTGRVQIKVEQIAGGFPIFRIQRHAVFERLARFGRIPGRRKRICHFRPASVGSS